MQSITPLFAAAEAAPAGGAETKEVLIASVMVGAIFSLLVLTALAHRAGRIKILDRLGYFAGRQLSLPNWVALPSAILVGSLFSAVFGLYWDISLHLSQGRDAGPLANPSHYFILVGLLGCFSAGVLAITMPKPGTRPSPYSIRLTDQWYAPLGGVLIAASAAFGLTGFPLDDLWHRMFGQDVTLWGPTHLLMLAGASLTLIGQAILLVEGVRAGESEDFKPRFGERGNAIANKIRKGCAGGGILVALSIYQGEFDFGIPQFQLVFHPIMILAAAGTALVFARSWAGRGGALIAVTLYLIVRSVLALLVAGVFDRPTPHFPLYIGAALAVEAAALLTASSGKSNPMKFAAVAGLGVGTFGLAAEWGWSHVWMIFPWPSSLWPEGAIAGFIAAIAGASVGAWMANSLSMRPRLVGATRFAPVLGVIAVFALVGYGLSEDRRHDVTASVTTQTVDTGKPGRWITATVKLNTTDFDDTPKWAQGLAWQGPGFVNADLVHTGPGSFALNTPLPASGKWKTVLRFHSGNAIIGMPLFEPRDDAIPAPETPAPANFTRALQPDREILQRESTVDGGTTAMAGYFTMLAIALSLLGALGWGIARVGKPDDVDSGTSSGAGAGGIPEGDAPSGPSRGAKPLTPHAA
ncbi:MAG: hypothetical protein WAP35_03120 [Solirubrobacterales bacterium]